MNTKAHHSLTKFTYYLVLISILVSLFSIILLASTKAFAQSSTATIVLTPDKQTLATGDTLKLTVKIDTGGNGVNVYTASLAYPKDKLDYVSADFASSPFSMGLESKGGDGNVKITRGTPTTQTGTLLVGVVTFKAKSSVSASSITVANDSAVIRSSDNTNLLPGSTVQDTKKASTTSNESMMTPTTAASNENFFSKILHNISSFFSSFFK